MPSVDVDGDGACTPLDLLIVINAINQFDNVFPIVTGGLSPSSDPNNNRVVLSNHVRFIGQTTLDRELARNI